mgnify:FL=1|jgi:hypothetical protein|tara:strand:+ start:21 stop:467 length:447 start_codon:yes stop_codon:yes gene_type:complete
MNKQWIEHNKNIYGVQIIELKKIISEQVRHGGKADMFISDMLVAMVSGRKITPKMESAIDNIIKRNSPEELYKRNDWLATVLPKLLMVRAEIDKTNWSMGYRKSQDDFMSSIINQAKHRKTLSQKQMETVSAIYSRIKNNIADNANNA